MARRITRKSMKQDDFVEAAFDAKQWLERHWRTVAMGIGGVIVAAALFGGWTWWRGYKLDRTRESLNAALELYHPSPGDDPSAASESARYTQALEAFEAASRQGGSSTLGQMGSFYRATTLLKLGRSGEAIPVLEDVIANSEERTLRDTARAVLARAYEENGSLVQAADTWRALSDDAGSAYPPDMALLNLGHLLQAQGNGEEAQRTWQELVARYPDGVASREAQGVLGQPPQ